MNDDHAELVEAARAGDRAAAEALLRAVQDGVGRLALRMTGNVEDARDATQEILVKVLTRLSTFRGDAAFTTWAHRIAVNHLIDRRRSSVERSELTFSAFADDLREGLVPVARNAAPDLDVLAREVKHGCTLAMLTCLDRDLRIAYVLGEVFEVSSAEGAWICEVSEAAYRKRLSRARAAVRAFVAEHCGLVAGDAAPCHCRRRVPVAIRLGRIDARAAERAGPADVAAAVAEMEALHDAASLVRNLPDAAVTNGVVEQVAAILDSGRFTLFDDARHDPGEEAPGDPPPTHGG